ncbi:MAG TPA: nucleotidyltransferase family protein [Acidimicrobiales bacterium]
MAIAAIVLAAGGGSRFLASGGEGNKLLAPCLGRTVAEWSIEHAATAGLDATYVVVGDNDVRLPPDVGVVRIVRNERWADGLAASLQAGLRAAKRDGYGTVVVGLADQPLVPAEAWRRVARTSAPIAVATYDGVRGNPVRLSSHVWPLLPTTGDEGARKVMRRRPDVVVEVPCPGSAADVDTVDDLDDLASGPTIDPSGG